MIDLALERHLELAMESREGSGQPITVSAVLVTTIIQKYTKIEFCSIDIMSPLTVLENFNPQKEGAATKTNKF